MNKYVIIEGVPYNINTTEQCMKAMLRMHAAALPYADVWVGGPEDPDSYRNGKILISLDL